MCSILVARVTQYKNVNICSFNEKWECIIHFSECSTEHTRNLSKILVFSLPNRILVNEMFIGQKTFSCEYSNWEGPKAVCNEHHRPLFTLMPTLPEPFLSPVHKCFQPSGYSVQCAYMDILMIKAYILWCRMPDAPRVSSLGSLSWNWHAFYMLCNPVLMFYEQQPVFHVHVSTWSLQYPQGLQTHCSRPGWKV